MPVEKFKSKGAYMRNLAYRHIHGIPMTATKVCIKGEGCHKVDHKDSGPQRKKIDAAQKRKVAKRGTEISSGKRSSGRTGRYTHGKRSQKKKGRGK